MGTTSIIAPIKTGNIKDVEYENYLSHFKASFSALTQDAPLFTTDTEGLFDTYLAGFSASERQFHDCRSCRQFIERFGALVVIAPDGTQQSALWQIGSWTPGVYLPAIEAMAKKVAKAKVTGVFKSSASVLGNEVTGIWRHYSVSTSPMSLHRGLTTTADQVMAEKKEDYGIVCRALADLTLPVLAQALTLLEADVLYRSEKVSAPVQWLKELHTARNSTNNKLRANITWLAVATAPAGFCHVRNSMAGTLLDDIASGMQFEEVSRRFAAKMHPLQYQRPQVAPSAGTVAQAEKIIAKLGAEGSLSRRFMRPYEVVPFWTAPEVAKKESSPSGGVFSNVKTKGMETAKPLASLPVQTFTWDKFRRTILPTAEKIEYFLGNRSEPFTTLVTAVNPESTPIVQWDEEQERNPASWYLWHGGSAPSQFGLDMHSWVNVYALAQRPCHWGTRSEIYTHFGEGVLFMLEGAHESRMSGNALFPEILKSELHGIRSVLEAYSRDSVIEGIEDTHAVGCLLDKNKYEGNMQVRVLSSGQYAEYRIDRWD